MYIYDAAWGPDTANAAHIVNNPGTCHDIMVEVLDCLQLVNPYIPLYRQAHDVLCQGHSSVVHLQLAVPPGVDRRHFQHQMRLLPSFLGTMNMLLLEETSLFSCTFTMTR